jgi:hypothetical protein
MHQPQAAESRPLVARQHTLQRSFNANAALFGEATSVNSGTILDDARCALAPTPTQTAAGCCGHDADGGDAQRQQRRRRSVVGRV